MIDLQDTSPVQAENENGKASAVQCKTNPVEVKEQVFRQLLTVQHAEGGRVYTKTETLAQLTRLMHVDQYLR
jgi:hypothetical protein